MRRFAVVTLLTLTAAACSSSGNGSAEPPTTTVAPAVSTTATALPAPTTTSTAAPTTTTTVVEGVQSIAQREAELIEIISADATGPEEWVQVAARALAAEQLILERPGEVDLLDYFTPDSPYLEETVRPGEAALLRHGHRLDGLLSTLQSVVVVLEPVPGRVALQLTTEGRPAVLRSDDGTVVSDIPVGAAVTVMLTLAEAAGPWRIYDRGSESLVP